MLREQRTDPGVRSGQEQLAAAARYCVEPELLERTDALLVWRPGQIGGARVRRGSHRNGVPEYRVGFAELRRQEPANGVDRRERLLPAKRLAEPGTFQRTSVHGA